MEFLCTFDLQSPGIATTGAAMRHQPAAVYLPALPDGNQQSFLLHLVFSFSPCSQRNRMPGESDSEQNQPACPYPGLNPHG